MNVLRGGWLFVAIAYICVLSSLAKAAKTTPPLVGPGEKGFGGGSADLRGHGRPMQEVGNPSPIAELKEMPSWEVFYADYVRVNRPVVLRGAARAQPAFNLWTDEYLTKIWGSQKQVQAEIAKVEVRGGRTISLPFNQFVKEIYKENRKDELYAVIGVEDDMKALKDVDLPEPARCKEIWPQSVTLWMSAGGTQSVLHNDDAENFLMLLDGIKNVMLVHQDEAPNFYAPIAKVRGTAAVQQDNVDMVAFPRMANLSWLQGELGPGDTLYIPHTYWHQVNSQGRNLGLNIWWQHRGDYQWWDLKKYDATAFGGPNLPPFDEFKAASARSLNCTPLSPRQHMDKTKLVEEGETKKRFKKFQNADAKKKKKTSQPSRDDL